MLTNDLRYVSAPSFECSSIILLVLMGFCCEFPDMGACLYDHWCVKQSYSHRTTVGFGGLMER